MSNENDSVKVAVRIRPLIETETNSGCQSVVFKTPSEQQVIVKTGHNISFTFDHVFAQDDTQETLYENAVKNIMMNLFNGYNVTILAYGQTGSGKTHTMGTSFNGFNDESSGVIPRAVQDIFDKIDELAAEHEITVSCSFVELYKEKLYDLLSTNPRDQSVVDIREDRGKIVIPNLKEVPVESALQTTNCLLIGSKCRSIGQTAMNAVSSRSHAIFTITVHKTPRNNPAAATIAKFHLVDLAGSERVKKTQAVGERFNEGVKINKALFTLGNVIEQLGLANQNNVHVNYRDSKLTRLLQDSLGGNSMTLMIACVSPADDNLDETLGTLRYADRAKKIKNKPVVNEDPKSTEINRLKAENEKLREILSNSETDRCKQCEQSPTNEQLHKQLCDTTDALRSSLLNEEQQRNKIIRYEQTIKSMEAMLKTQIDELNSAKQQAQDYKERLERSDAQRNRAAATEHEKKRPRTVKKVTGGKKRGCGCRSDCKEGSCGCRKNGSGCSDVCKCGATCDNIFNDKLNDTIDDEDKENNGLPKPKKTRYESSIP